MKRTAGGCIHTGQHAGHGPAGRWACLAMFLALLLALAVAPASALAHPADQHLHALAFAFEPDTLRLRWEFRPAPLLVQIIWQEADLDGDGGVSEAEARGWAEANAPRILVALDETQLLDLRVEAVDWADSLEGLQAGEELIVVSLAAGWPSRLTGMHRLDVVNNFETSYSTTSFGALNEESQRLLQSLEADAWHAVVQFQPASAEIPPAGESVAPAPALTGAAGQPAVPVKPAPETASARLTSLLRNESSAPAYYVLALAIALGLGALHALTPGHGKTVVAAYLVGSRGRARHAVTLGGVTTLTHTGSVLLLGLATLLISRFVLPGDLFPWLEAASGILIVLLGGWLLWQRWRAWRSRPADDLPHSHAGDDHSHAHHHHGHLPGEGEHVGWRALVALGVSGGLIPCPDAIAILLLAVAVQRIGFGLALIVSFSLGLAAVLTAVGLLMVSSRQLFDRLTVFDRVAPVLPTVSALVVLALGLGLTVRALG